MPMADDNMFTFTSSYNIYKGEKKHFLFSGASESGQTSWKPWQMPTEPDQTEQ